MSTAVAESSSLTDDSDPRIATRALRPDDWLLPNDDIENSKSNKDDTTPSSNGDLLATTKAPHVEVTSPVRRNPIVYSSDRRIAMLQQWECVILGVSDDCVKCEMHDLTNAANPAEFAEVYTNEFSPFDQALLEEGAVFYWSIGHETHRTGQVRRYSELRVCRMPRLSTSRHNELIKEAEHLSKLFESAGQ